MLTGAGKQTWPDLSLVFAPDRVLFETETGPVTGTSFLYMAHRLALSLPDKPIVPVCADVFCFTLLFAATLIKGQYVLLSSDRAHTRLTDLARQHDAVCVSLEGDPEEASLPEGGKRIAVDTYWKKGDPHSDNGDGFNPVLAPDCLVAVVFTSGSTGQPVGHRKYWGGLVTRSVTARVLIDPEPELATVIGTVPPYHMYGFETLVLQALNTRVRTVAGSIRYPADWVTRLEKAAPPRILVTTPLQLRGLIKSGLVVPALRRIVSASAPLADTLAAEAERSLETEVTEIYGSTETGSVAIRRTVNGPDWRWYDNIRLHVQKDGRVELTAPGALTYTLSDFIEPLDSGTFRLLGRVTDLVKLGGKRVSLAALNGLLSGLSGVEDGAFLPPDTSAMDPSVRMQVFVVAPSRSGSAILQDLRQVIDPVFLPRRVVMVPELPRNSVGKLTLQALRALAATQGSEQEMGTVTIFSDHPCFPGHFPAQPVVPGVLLLEAGMALIKRADVQVHSVKFLRPVLPDQQVQFILRHTEDALRLTGLCEGQLVLRAILKVRSGATDL